MKLWNETILSMLVQHWWGAELFGASGAQKWCFSCMDSRVIVQILLQIEFFRANFACVIFYFQMNHFDVSACCVPWCQQFLAFGAEHLFIFNAQIWFDVSGWSIRCSWPCTRRLCVDHSTIFAVTFLQVIFVANDRVEEGVAYGARERLAVGSFLVIIVLPTLIECFLAIGALEYRRIDEMHGFAVIQ